MAMLTDEEAQAAKDRLHAAIVEYYQVVEPDKYIAAWVLVTDKDSVELTRNNQSMVSTLEPTHQSWPLTVGMLMIASDQARTLIGTDDDDEL